MKSKLLKMNMKLKQMAQELSVTKEKLTRRAYAVLGGLFATGYHIANGLGSGKPFFSHKNS